VRAQVGVSEALDGVLAAKDGLEQMHVFRREKIESSPTPSGEAPAPFKPNLRALR